MPVLLIGSKDDIHNLSIIRELNKINQKYFLLDEITFKDSIAIEMQAGKTNPSLKINNIDFLADKIKSIWNAGPIKINGSNKIEKSSIQFAAAEWEEGFMSLYNSMSCKWINHPTDIKNASNKIKQLQIASSIRFNIPKTLITNDIEKFMKFFNSCEKKILAKTVHGSKGVGKNKMIYSELIEEQDLKYLSDLKYAPTIFQEYISKKTELRLTVIGDIIHTTEIQSQNSSKTKVDWRKYDTFDKTPYHISKIPKELSEKVLKLLDRMNLRFGTIDLIKKPDGDYVFLEINSHGRWWWIQEITGINIARDIASYLSKD